MRWPVCARATRYLWTRLALIGAVLAGLAPLTMAQPCVQPQINEAFPLYGDINGSGVVNVADAICITLASFWASGAVATLPACVADDAAFADITCDGETDVSDVIVAITLVLSDALPTTVDSTGRGCYDECITSLQISPTSASLGAGQTQAFTGTGGLPPYSYSVAAGGGTISAAGLYTAPGVSGTATVRVTDAAGSMANASVTILASLSLSPNPALVAPSGTQVFSASGGVPPYVYSVVSGGGSFSGASYTAPSSGTTAVVKVTDSVGATANANVTLTVGSVIFTAPGTTTWTVPAGITSVHAVVIGGGGGGGFLGGASSSSAYGGATSGGAGGGLSYRNNMAVSPGQVLTVIVGEGGASGFSNFLTSNNGAAGGQSSVVGYLSASGGGGGRTDNALPAVGSGSGGTANRSGGVGGLGFSGGSPGGGGGAAGYNGNGGAAATSNGGNGSAGSGGGGGGGSGGFTGNGYGGGAGGGVGLFGVGANGAGGVYNPADAGNSGTAAGGGAGGSNGTAGAPSGTGGAGLGGSYGGGGSGGRKHPSVTTGWRSSNGGPGAVRIIWGPGRSFPNNAN